MYLLASIDCYYNDALAILCVCIWSSVKISVKNMGDFYIWHTNSHLPHNYNIWKTRTL